MMKKAKFCILMLVVLVFVFAGCAMSSNKSADMVQEEPAYVQEDGQTVDVDEESVSPDSDVPAIDIGNVAASDKKMIFTVTIDLKVDNAADSIDEITDEAIRLGGYISDSSFSQEAERATGFITIRIPPEKLDDLTEIIGDLGEVVDSNLSSQDVTDQYVDAQSRLTNAEAQETQLLAIMEQAVKIEDILSVRTELNLVQEEIEIYKGQIRLMDNQVGYSTVTVYLTQNIVPVSPEVDPDEGIIARWSFDYVWKSIQKGFTNSASFSLNAIGAILILLSYLLVPILLMGGLVFGIIAIVKITSKRKARKNRPQ
jgi:hypothetical protein